MVLEVSFFDSIPCIQGFCLIIRCTTHRFRIKCCRWSMHVVYINIFCENKKRMSLSTWKYQFSCDHWSQATSGSARWQHTYFEWFFKSVGCKWFMPNGLNHDFQLKNISETISGRTILISMILTFSRFKEFQHFQILTFSDSDTFRICHKMTSYAWIFFYFNMHWILL